jgi:hypothetical protein
MARPLSFQILAISPHVRRLAHFPLAWNHANDKKSRRINVLARILIKKSVNFFGIRSGAGR